jgi:uncharacterized membrane protein YkoI
LPKPYGGIQIAFKAGDLMRVEMNTRLTLFVALAALCAVAAPAPVPAMAPKADQQSARKQMNDGKVMSLRQIEGIILPRMKGMEYLGPEYDQDAKVYRLKFIDEGRVIFVDVDARTGQIIRQR